MALTFRPLIAHHGDDNYLTKTKNQFLHCKTNFYIVKPFSTLSLRPKPT